MDLISLSDKRFAGFKKDEKQLDAEIHRKYIFCDHVASNMRVGFFLLFSILLWCFDFVMSADTVQVLHAHSYRHMYYQVMCMYSSTHDYKLQFEAEVHIYVHLNKS